MFSVQANEPNAPSLSANPDNIIYRHTQRLDQLKQLIYDTLDPLIDGDYCLLDIPDYPNIGDQLIYEGEREYLKRLNHKMLYVSNDKYEDFKKVPKNAIILLNGGGNFGDLWRSHSLFRIKVINNFKSNKIIIFPQTVFYKNLKILLQDAEIFNQHPDLTICARDTESYNLLKKYFVNNNILLLPDMAFCLDLSKYKRVTKTNKALVILRKDKEVNKNFDLENIKKLVSGNRKIEVKDWPSLENIETKFKLLSLVNYLNRAISRKFLTSSLFRLLLDNRYGLLRGNLSKWYMQEGVKFINEYEEVYTTRLHGYILSVLLGKKVYMIDNSYGKNGNFYHTWMTEFENSYYLEA